MELVEIILFGSLQFTDIDVLAQKYRLGWVVPLVGTPSCTPKGCGLNSHSGLIPRCKFGPYLGHVGEATYQCLSPSLKSINILLKKKKYEGKTKTTGPLKAEVQSALESRSAGLASYPFPVTQP